MTSGFHEITRSTGRIAVRECTGTQLLWLILWATFVLFCRICDPHAAGQASTALERIEVIDI